MKGVGEQMSTVKAKKPVADFTEGRITGKMIKFALPLMATALLQSFYNAADMMVVGNFAPNGAFAMPFCKGGLSLRSNNQTIK